MGKLIHASFGQARKAKPAEEHSEEIKKSQGVLVDFLETRTNQPNDERARVRATFGTILAAYAPPVKAPTLSSLRTNLNRRICLAIAQSPIDSGELQIKSDTLHHSNSLAEKVKSLRGIRDRYNQALLACISSANHFSSGRTTSKSAEAISAQWDATCTAILDSQQYQRVHKYLGEEIDRTMFDILISKDAVNVIEDAHTMMTLLKHVKALPRSQDNEHDSVIKHADVAAQAILKRLQLTLLSRDQTSIRDRKHSKQEINRVIQLLNGVLKDTFSTTVILTDFQNDTRASSASKTIETELAQQQPMDIEEILAILASITDQIEKEYLVATPLYQKLLTWPHETSQALIDYLGAKGLITTATRAKLLVQLEQPPKKKKRG